MYIRVVKKGNKADTSYVPTVFSGCEPAACLTFSSCGFLLSQNLSAINKVFKAGVSLLAVIVSKPSTR